MTSSGRDSGSAPRMPIPTVHISPPRHGASLLLLLIPMVFLLLFYVVPVGSLLLSGLYGSSSLTHTAGAGPSLLGPISLFFANSLYLNSLWLTLGFSFLVTIVSLILAFPVAYYISTRSPRTRAYLTLLTLSPLMVSVVVRAFGWVVILAPAGFLNRILTALNVVRDPLPLMYTDLAALIGLLQAYLPFMILAILLSIQDIPETILLAAQNLGTAGPSLFARVILPLSAPGILAGSLIVFSLTMSSFVTPSILGGSHVEMLASLAYQQAMFGVDWPFAAAICIILLIVTLAVIAAWTALLRGPAFSGAFERNEPSN